MIRRRNRKHATVEEKFRKFMPEAPPSEGCWNWTGCTSGNGYGKLGVGPRSSQANFYAHRVAYQIFVGPIPNGLMVRHSCDNRVCCQPRHLLLGTAAENSRDMVERGRNQVGSQCHSAKLTEDDIRLIRSLYASGLTQATIASQFGVGRENIGWIVRNKTWRSVVG